METHSNMYNHRNRRDEAHARAVDGHNILITGQCGTGKTYLLKKIVETLRNTGKHNIAVTATTGMASLQLGFNATTLHHWAGIMDGRYTHEQLAELFDGDDQFASARERIRTTTCLVIDEISMLSMKVFDMVEFVCRHVKQNNNIFGNIQILGCGDFKQLPPVPNLRYDDDGKYSFESAKFNLAFPHHINLNEVVRQHENALILAVNELCDGLPSKETVDFLKGLQRPLDVREEEVTRLFGTNFDTQYINHVMLEDMEGDVVVYKSKDEGRKIYIEAEKANFQTDGKRVLSHENRAKKRSILERWTDSLQILDKIFGLEKDSDDEGNDDNLEVLKIMRKVEQKIKFRTNKNEIDLITEVDVKFANLESKKKSPPRLVVLKNADKTISSIYIVRDGLKIYLRGRKRHN